MPNVTLICVSNSRQYYQTLDARVRSRLNAALVEFRPYDREQIGQILEQRAEMVSNLAGLQDKLKERIARVARGDARVALRTLQHAIVAAEAAGARQLLPEHVRAGQREAREAKNRYVLAKLGEHHTLIYGIIQDGREVESGDLWREYRLRCRRARMRPAAPRTFSLYLRRLIDWNLLVHRRKLGVKGNIRVFGVRNGSR
jgi:Cdc6-like AAA superfamily ATPase